MYTGLNASNPKLRPSDSLTHKGLEMLAHLKTLPQLEHRSESGANKCFKVDKKSAKEKVSKQDKTSVLVSALLERLHINCELRQKKDKYISTC